MTTTGVPTGNNSICSLRYLVVLAVFSFAPMKAWCADAIPDNEISVQVESEFLIDPVVPFNIVDVNTDEGIVTLGGSVPSLLAKERSTKIAETVRGVRAVVNLIEVTPPIKRSGRSLQQSVEAALLYDATTDPYKITVSADDKGRVTLEGTVPTRRERNLVEIVVKSVSGVISLANNIAVKPNTPRSTAEIKTDIEQRLSWDTLVDDAMIAVRVEGSKVFLSGEAGSAAEKRRAEWDAWVNGVDIVDSSDLKVVKWARDKHIRGHKYAARTDSEIRDAVRDALHHDPRVNSFNVDVKAKNGIVTLRAVVDNIQAKKAAERDARNTVGVSAVRSLIKVRSDVRIDDQTIADNVKAAQSRNPITEDHEIDVHVKNHIVRMSGMVDTNFEKAEAENIAFHARGVTAVRNDLKVRHPETVVHNPYVYEWSIYDHTWYGSPTLSTPESDWQLIHDIRDELIWSPFVDSEDINVVVLNGVATLTGTVDSWSEYSAARENAFEGGATIVINKIEVK